MHPPISLLRSRPALPAALRTVAVERQALDDLHAALSAPPLGAALEQAAAMIGAARGRVVVSGMGKSGLVGRKLAATFSSTGTPALFLHPAEASHGDLGMITADDIVLALSWSGETGELSDLLSYCGRFEVPLIAVTSQSPSTLSKSANVTLLLPSVEEACPNRLAPTSSTILQASIGDALAVSLIEVRGFSVDDFRTFHPKGRLGGQLVRVADIMSTGDALPIVADGATILCAMLEMTRKRFGMTGVVDAAGHLIGAFSDGDLRRGLTVTTIDGRVSDHMTAEPLVIGGDRLASEAVKVMNDKQVTQLFICDDGRPVGIVHLHDILRHGTM